MSRFHCRRNARRGVIIEQMKFNRVWLRRLSESLSHLINHLLNLHVRNVSQIHMLQRGHFLIASRSVQLSLEILRIIRSKSYSPSEVN